MNQITIKEKREAYDISKQIFNFINNEFFDNELVLNCFCINSKCPLSLTHLRDAHGGYYSDCKAILLQSERKEIDDIVSTFNHELAHLIEHQNFNKRVIRTSHCKRFWDLYGRVSEIWYCMYLQEE